MILDFEYTRSDTFIRHLFDFTRKCRIQESVLPFYGEQTLNLPPTQKRGARQDARSGKLMKWLINQPNAKVWLRLRGTMVFRRPTMPQYRKNRARQATSHVPPNHRHPPMPIRRCLDLRCLKW